MSTRDVWERRVARWAKSGLSRGEFADREGVKATTLGWWRWALRTTAPREGAALVKSDVAFIEVEALATDARIEVALANGRVVRVPSPFNEQELGRVLAIAERA